VPLAVGVGVGFAAVGLVCLKLGPLAMASLVTVVVVVAAAEAYGAVRRAGYRPATLLGLVATVAVVVAAYAKGLSALPLVTVIVVLATMLWYLFRVGKGSPLQGMGVTVLVFGWVGLLGSYGGLLVAPSLFPDRHGVAFIFGAIAAVVAADVGALAFGTWLGRRPLAPTVSPGKTWEGAIGGGIVAIVVSTLLVGHVHPWTPASAAVLGVLAAVLGPLGDLCESLVKRELGIKDMGSVLPGHGGILDRVDGLLFLLPATFYLVRALHLG
jgi:phosphatidate cytidylyltransferase